MMTQTSWNVIFVIYSAFVCNLVFAAQHFTVTPIDQSAVVGDTVTFHCTIAEKKGYLTWLQDGSPLNFDTAMSTSNADYSIVYSISTEGEAFNLQISNVGHDDAKNYQCTVTQGGGDSGVISTQVSLTVTDSVPQSFSRTPSDATILVGNSAVVECAISDKEGTVIWSKDGVDISSDATITNGDNRFSITGNQNNGEYNLQIVNADTQDAGTYACRVTASGTSAQIGPIPALLRVQELQSFVIQPASTDALEGSDVTIFCSVSNKAGQLVWSLNGEDISSDSTISTSTSGYTINSPIPSVDYNLKIESVRQEHAGNYVCSVTSANGLPEITSDTAVLTVFEHPTELPTERPIRSTTDHSTTRGTDYQTLHLNEHPVVWPIESSIEVTIVRATERHTELSTESVTERSTERTIESTTEHSSENATQLLFRAPTCAPSTVSTLILGENLILVCETERDEPAAILRWIQDGGDVREGITLETSTAIRVGLFLTITEHLQGSVFTCESTHPTLHIKEACQVGPIEVDSSRTEIKLFSKEAEKYAKVGEHIIMECSIQNKLGTIQWIRDGHVISSDTVMKDNEHEFSRYFIGGDQSIGEYYLNIDRVSKHDAGIYYCLLSSYVDRLPLVSSKDIRLQIADPIPPESIYPQCTISSNYVIEGDTVLLTCISKGGDPPATLQWDKNGNNQDGIHIDESTLSLHVNISNEINGATFTCTSKHSTFNQSHTCVIGPLKVTSMPNGNDWYIEFVVTLIILILTILIIVFLLVILLKWKLSFPRILPSSHV